MKEFLENSLGVGRSEGPLALRGYYEENKPKKPKTSLTKLFEDNSGQQVMDTTQETQKFLESKLPEISLPDCPLQTDFSGSESWPWSEMADRIKTTSLHCQRRNGVSLSSHIDMGYLLELGFNKFQDEKILGRQKGTFDKWIQNNAKMTSRHARKLREIARVIQPYPRFRDVGLSLIEVYQHLRSIRMVLEIDKYKEFWSSTTEGLQQAILAGPPSLRT